MTTHDVTQVMDLAIVDAAAFNLAAMQERQERDRQAREDFQTMTEALELLVKLWPSPAHATVTLETHEWRQLRKVLVAMPRLWVEAYQ